MTTHVYRSTLAWAGSTATGYDGYDRAHRVTARPAAGELTLGSDATFRGDAQPLRITRITQRPRIRLAAGSDLERARRLVDRAHQNCFIASSLRAEVRIEAGVDCVEEH